MINICTGQTNVVSCVWELSSPNCIASLPSVSIVNKEEKEGMFKYYVSSFDLHLRLTLGYGLGFINYLHKISECGIVEN